MKRNLRIESFPLAGDLAGQYGHRVLDVSTGRVLYSTMGPRRAARWWITCLVQEMERKRAHHYRVLSPVQGRDLYPVEEVPNAKV